MKYVNTKTGWAIAIIILVVINIATLATLWYGRGGGKHHSPPNGGGGAAKFLIKELAFDSTQQQAYLALVAQHQQAVRDIREQVKDAKENYFNLLADSTASGEKIKAAIDKATTMEEQIDIKTFEHFKQVRALCNSEQKKKFDAIIKEVVGMMGTEKHQGPPPPSGQKAEGGGMHRPPPPPNDDGFPPPPNGPKGERGGMHRPPPPPDDDGFPPPPDGNGPPPQ